MSSELTFSVVHRDEWDILFRGEYSGPQIGLRSKRDIESNRIGANELIAVFPGKQQSITKEIWPCLLIVESPQLRENLAWITTYLSDVVPISQWCRIVEPSQIIDHTTLKLVPSISGLEAAWAGAVIGEVIARGTAEISEISLLSCLSSATYVFARCSAIWPDKKSPADVVSEMSEIHKLLKAEARRELEGLSDVWRVLLSLQFPSTKLRSTLSGSEQAILRACWDVQEIGSIGQGSIELLTDYCKEAAFVGRIDEITAEDRVRLLDSMLLALKKTKDEKERIQVFAFLVGYIVSKVGAGEKNLELLSPFYEPLPIAAVWCNMLAGLYQPIRWSKAFGGLGRLIVKELLRVVSLDHCPTADISVQELRTMIGEGVNFKQLPFRPASLRVAMVELLPGVEFAVSLRSYSQITTEENGTAGVIGGSDISLNDIDALVRDVEKALTTFSKRRKGTSKSTRKRSNQKKSGQSKLI